MRRYSASGQYVFPCVVSLISRSSTVYLQFAHTTWNWCSWRDDRLHDVRHCSWLDGACFEILLVSGNAGRRTWGYLGVGVISDDLDQQQVVVRMVAGPVLRLMQARNKFLKQTE